MQTLFPCHVLVLIGQLFRDRYAVSGQRLGDGSVGAVYLAGDLQSGRQLACKIHNLDKLRTLERQQQAIRRVNDESDILSKLKHVGFLHASPSGKWHLLTYS